jgi:phosphatidylglycerophosphate synthase
MSKLVEQAVRDRRPLKVRDMGPWAPAARWCGRHGITPNLVSGGGLLIGVASGALLAATGYAGCAPHVWWLGLLAVLANMLRGCCNILDGVIAVETSSASPVGTLWNEIPDRVSDAATLIGAGYALGGSPTLGWAAALGAVLTAYVRAQARVAGAPMDFRGPMAKPARMSVLSVAVLWASLAPAAWQPSLGREAQYGAIALALSLVVGGCVITVLRRLRAAAAALRASA